MHGLASVDVSGFAAGVYTLTVNAGEREARVQVMVVR